MSTRTNDPSSRFKGVSDFVVRKQKPYLWQILALFCIVLLLCLVVTVFSFTKVPLIVFLFLLLAPLGGYMIVLLQRTRDLVLATEFQNALFASALDYNRTFCLIIKNDGNIMYMDRSFQKIFSDFVKEGHLSLVHLLRQGKVNVSEQEKIFAAIEQGTADEVITSMYGSDGRLYKLVVSIEPLPRPAGFVVLHSREYVEKRREVPQGIGAAANPSLLSKSTLTFFSSIMDQINTGIYVVDLNGTIIYANAILENWLSYHETEISDGGLPIRDIVQHEDGKAVVFTENYDGNIILKKRTGQKIRAFISQKIIFGDDKQPIGSLAMITAVAENDMNTNIQSW